jgi:hypothetical protein
MKIFFFSLSVALRAGMPPCPKTPPRQVIGKKWVLSFHGDLTLMMREQALLPVNAEKLKF